MNPIPHLSSELIEQLDETHPHRCPSPKQSEREIWMQAGERLLIDRLLQRKKAQDEDGELETISPTGD